MEKYGTGYIKASYIVDIIIKAVFIDILYCYHYKTSLIGTTKLDEQYFI